MTQIESLAVPFGTVFAEPTNLINDEYFVWVKLDRRPTVGELKEFCRSVRKMHGTPYLYANVDSHNERNMRFAEFFGFHEVRKEGSISVQVFEGNEQCF